MFRKWIAPAQVVGCHAQLRAIPYKTGEDARRSTSTCRTLRSALKGWLSSSGRLESYPNTYPNLPGHGSGGLFHVKHRLVHRTEDTFHVPAGGPWLDITTRSIPAWGKYLPSAPCRTNAKRLAGRFTYVAAMQASGLCILSAPCSPCLSRRKEWRDSTPSMLHTSPPPLVIGVWRAE